MNEIAEKMRAFERWFFRLPEHVIMPLIACAVIWLLVSCMQFWIGVVDAPKSYSMRKIEVVFPGYQMGLWAGSRFNGESRIAQ